MRSTTNYYNQRYMFLIILFLTFFLNSNILYSQENSHKIKLNWIISKNLIDTVGNFEKYLNFSGSVFVEKYGKLPVFSHSEKIDCNCNFIIELVNPEYQIIDDPTLIHSAIITSQPEIYQQISYIDGIPYANFTVSPYRKNSISGQIEILNSFDYRIILKEELPKIALKKVSSASHSVLANGNWYKLQIAESGVYKIDYNYLTSIGINPEIINPKNIKIFGNGGGLLPQLNSASRIDDLAENSIYVYGESDGKFDKGDYILFYANGAHSWNFDSDDLIFKHKFNTYSDFSYYFLSFGDNSGKRVAIKATPSGTALYSSSTYNFHAFHELNLQTDISDYVKSGRDLYGEDFNYTTIRKFPFYIPNIDNTLPVKLFVDVAARSGTNSSFDINIDGNTFKLNIGSTNINDYIADYCIPANDIFSFFPTSANQDCTMKYNKVSSNSIGWLNYIDMNARAKLVFFGNQLSFRDTGAINSGISEFQLTSIYTDMIVWNVTDPINTEQPELTVTGSNSTFKTEGSKLQEFIAFRQGTGLTPKFVEKIVNQDLHSVQNVDMVIITHPLFKAASDKLADFHRNNDTLQVYVTTPGQIYNEFSSGAQDITAIRDFMKMLYDRGVKGGKKPKYLLLFGDASYDYKDILKDNTNFVPTYESYTSYSPTYSYANDDYYGFMDNNEGNYDNDGSRYDNVDIAVGRIPVQSASQALEMVEKIINYKSTNSFAEWRNNILLIADDEDRNDYFKSSQDIDGYFTSYVKEITVSKIYLDAFVQLTTPGGNRYPDAQLAITKKVNSGCFVVNYIGHGGEQYLAHEKVIEIPDIRSWTNYNKLSLFVTATCEFTRFDDPERVSAGELVYLNPIGGAIVMLTTTRVVYSNENDALINNLFKDNLFNENNGNFSRIGDIVKTAKNRTGFGVNTRKFIILGDPALVLDYPKHEVVTTLIKVDTSSNSDTLKALSTVTISGEIRDHMGIKLSDFNGILYPTIYDKASDLRTLGNDPTSTPASFKLFNNIIYKGVVSVTNGNFTFSFVVPKDISYKYGFGKISYYATNNITDANGEYSDIIVGGSISNVPIDTTGPKVQLFMNDSNFVRGGITNENPWLYAKVSDENGINTVGNGIGHEIIGVLDGGEPIILNDYYRGTLNSYKEGIIKYPFSNLLIGKHQLYIKVWDVMNNSAEATTEFEVKPSLNIAITNLYNYPNPVVNGATTFSFETNLSGKPFTASLQIFNQMGQLIKTIKKDINTESSRVTSLTWDLKNDQDPAVPNGLYLYRLIIEDLKGQAVSKSNKLILGN